LFKLKQAIREHGKCDDNKEADNGCFGRPAFLLISGFFTVVHCSLV
jgi:hypothetical protein